MSYRGHRGGRGGPNRGGGRGRGRPPPGLSGRDIGMFYKQKSLQKKQERERKERAVVEIDRSEHRKISAILKEVREGDEPMHPTSSEGAVALPPATLKVDCDGPSSSGAVRVEEPMEYQVGKADLSRDPAVDAILLKEQQDKTSRGPKYMQLQEFRHKLPSFQLRDDIVSTVASNQVVVISGETGCGKTTQVTQFILDAEIAAGRGSMCQVVCTQPRRISAISVAERVAMERGEPCGQNRSTGYQIRLEGKVPRSKGSITYVTTGVLLRWMTTDRSLLRASHIILDEVHERNIHTDFVLVILRDLLAVRPDVKLILMSATLNAEQFSQYFGGCPVINIPGFTYPVEDHYLEDILKALPHYRPQPARPPPPWLRHRNREKAREEEEQKEEARRAALALGGKYPPSVVDRLVTMNQEELDYDLIVAVIKHICDYLGEGAILVFLPGWDNISRVNDMLTADPVLRSNRYLLIPLHSMMPTVNQQSVFERPPPGVRKIVLATNIAETSITIDDVVYVVDPGKVKQTLYDVQTDLPMLQPVWVSQAAAKQRKGRAGRVQAGYCFHLYTAWRMGQLEEYQLPEMLRTPLAELVLQIKLLKLGMAEEFLSKALEPPEPKAVRNALRQLRQLVYTKCRVLPSLVQKALDRDEELTPLGHHLARLPVAPRLGKMILFGAMFSCVDPVLTVASALGFKEPFVVPLNKTEEADRVRRNLAGESRSDHIAIVNAFQGWERHKRMGWSAVRQYCWDNFLSVQTLEMLFNMKKQFAGLLYDAGFLPSSSPSEPQANHNSGNEKLVKAVLCAGLYPNVAKMDFKPKPGVPPRLNTREDGKVAFHPKSVNAKESRFPAKFLIYNTKVKSTGVFLHDTTVVAPFPLLFFGGTITTSRDMGQELICVDDWIQFQASSDIAATVMELRSELDRLLKQKIEDPRMVLYSPHSATPTAASQLVQAIIKLITMEDISVQVNAWQHPTHSHDKHHQRYFPQH